MSQWYATYKDSDGSIVSGAYAHSEDGLGRADHSIALIDGEIPADLINMDDGTSNYTYDKESEELSHN